MGVGIKRDSSPKVVDIWFGSSKYPASNAWLSNLYPRIFVVEGIRFNSVEQYFQYMKAYLFNDRIACNSILSAKSGVEAKILGRDVGTHAGSDPFDVDEWNQKSAGVMEEAIRESFRQNPAELEKLLSLGDFSFSHSHDFGRWGKLFPQILTKVRDGFLKERQELNTKVAPKKKPGFKL